MPEFDLKRLVPAIGIAAAGIGAAVALRTLLRKKDQEARGRVVLITGGSRGLGIALARAFAGDGCRIAICARDSSELDAARGDLEERGAEVLALEWDVTDRAQVERTIAR